MVSPIECRFGGVMLQGLWDAPLTDSRSILSRHGVHQEFTAHFYMNGECACCAVFVVTSLHVVCTVKRLAIE